MNFTDDFKMTRVRLCGFDGSNANGIQGYISDDAKTVPLTPIGNNAFNCIDWDIRDGSWIDKIMISYDTDKLNYIKMWTENNLVNIERGQQGANDLAFEIDFD